MSEIPFAIKPYGPRALLLEWPARVDPAILEDILGFAQDLQNHYLPAPDWELIPIYHTLTLIGSEDAGLERVRKELPKWYAARTAEYALPTRVWELPVCYEPPFAMDLQAVADALHMDTENLVQTHTSQEYRVFGIGFLPGFLYLGEVPEILRLPRREHPRQQVPPGSVGLAGAQTGIYPQSSPGGWHIIGNCPVPIFDPEEDPPCLAAPGDLVRFRAVSRGEYELHKLEGEVGIYKYKKDNSHAQGS